MTRPTARGFALLAMAGASFVAARIVGTWELYFVAFAFLATVAVCWTLVLATQRRLEVMRTVSPAQPVAGDPLVLRFRVKNGSLLPGLQVTLVDATGGLIGHDGSIDVEGLGPRSERVATSEPRPARRGVYRLPPCIAVAEDPLGLVRARRRFGETLALTVPPRLVHLPSFDLYTGTGDRGAGRRRRPPAVDATEFRGIRPHNPGEPLNRVDWKSTAKTGSLMLRELESATDGGLTVLLNAAASHLVGEAPDADFEVGVQTAGSIADSALRAGHPVTLLLPDGKWRPLRLSPNAESRRRLLAILAAAAPRGLSELGPSLRALAGGVRKDARTSSLIVIVLRLDRSLVHAVATLRQEGLPVAIVHVADDRREAAASAGEDLELRRSLAATGVRYLPVSRVEDLRAALSERPAARRRRSR